MILTEGNIQHRRKKERNKIEKTNCKKKNRSFFNQNQQKMIYSLDDGWISESGGWKFAPTGKPIKASVYWNVLGRTSGSICGSSPTIQGRIHPHLQGFADGLVEQATNNTLKMETESVSETSKNFHILTQLSTWELFTEFCRRESFKTDKDISVNLDPKIIVFKKTKDWKL